MTMPSKIYVQEWMEDGEHKYGEWTSYKSFGDDSYIRAEIAEELVRALESLKKYNLHSADRMAVNKALASFRAITP